MIRISGVHFRYDRTPVLADVTLAVESGTLCGLFGPNGSGKTTLFRCCLGLLRPDRGQILLNGKDIASLSPAETARIAAYVPQETRIPFPFKVKEVVLMGRTPHMGSAFLSLPEKDRTAVHHALEMVDILELAESRYDQLSGGQRQLVLIARAIAQHTPVLVLDEPTSALDFDNQVRIWRILGELTTQGITVLACSHDPNHISWFCDRVVMLNQGKVVADGNPESTINESTIGNVYRERCRVVEVGHLRVVLPETTRKSSRESRLVSGAASLDLGQISRFTTLKKCQWKK
jgi:iron complex transport system ATP-binding protein